MALAPGHLIGQIIGNVLEEALRPFLQEIADRHDLYLDLQRPRPGVRTGSKVSWTDDLGNVHDLDFVLERGGSHVKQGVPAAFIESAWRRYTKHSRAKAQEIQGAVLPVVQKWSEVGPVPAAVVAGEWSAPSLTQLRTSGFLVSHLNFAATVAAFAASDIDIRGSGEGTSDDFWQQQIDTFMALTGAQRTELSERLRNDNYAELATFAEELERRVVRQVASIVLLPLHGRAIAYQTVEAAIAGVQSYAGLDVVPRQVV